MQPIPTISSPGQLIDTHTKMVAQSPIIFRPYNHFPTTVTPSFDKLSTNEPRISAFEVVSKRPKTADIPLEPPLKFRRIESNHYNSLNLSKLISPSSNGNRIGDGKLSISLSKVYDSTSLSGKPNGTYPLNLEKNTLNHETASHLTCETFERACDLTTHHQHQQQQPPKVSNKLYKNDLNLQKPVIEYRFTEQGN